MVKRRTRAGQTVQVTDNGEPLWTVRAAVTTASEDKRLQDIDECQSHVAQSEGLKVVTVADES